MHRRLVWLVPVIVAMAWVSPSDWLSPSDWRAARAAVATTGSPLADPCAERPGPDQARIEAFVRAGCYERWESDAPAPHLSGRRVDGVEYTVHGRLRVFYTPGVAEWMQGKSPDIADGEMVVAAQYETDAGARRPRSVLAKVRDRQGSYDGWFWSTTALGGPAASSGAFGRSGCLGCHASAAKASTFLAARPPPPVGRWRPDEDLRWPVPPPPRVTRQPARPLADADAGFLALFRVPDVPASEVVPFPPPASDHVPAAPAARHPPLSFLSSDQCGACHNATQRLSSSRPDMWYPDPLPSDHGGRDYRNFSPYGEWSASINALAARDPVWHAQVENERILRPQLDGFTVNVCFSCHGPLGGRQLQIDRGDPNAAFTLDMFYARAGEPGALYGALAREGVSCTTCHRVEASGLGSNPPFDPENPHGHLDPSQLQTYTAQFHVDAAKPLYGPYATAAGAVMGSALGLGVVGGPTAAPQISQSRLCGSCHTVLVPAVPKGYKGTDPSTDPAVPLAFEQTTYWEWRNSLYQNETHGSGVPCQGCHMPAHRGREGRLLGRRIANLESDRFPPAPGRLPDTEIDPQPQSPFPRHVLLGVNLFVFSMFEQFPQILGPRPVDPAVPRETLHQALTGGDWIAEHAADDSVLVTVLGAEEKDGNLEVPVQVANYAGHKQPTGAGFRRAFLQLRVLASDGRVLWASGLTDRYGVILDGSTGRPLESEFTREPSRSQPHYQVITRQNQVQIYETRSLDAPLAEGGKLQTTVLGIVAEYKDNRLLPIGWSTQEPANPSPGFAINLFAMEPRLPAGVGMVPPPPPGAPAYCAAPPLQSYDPDYCDPDVARNGADLLAYRIPLSDVPGWTRVEARLLYQTIPPFYLRDRFEGGVDPKTGQLARDTRRLAHIASRLRLDGSPAEGWTLQLGNTSSRGRGERPAGSAASQRRITTARRSP